MKILHCLLVVSLMGASISFTALAQTSATAGYSDAKVRADRDEASLTSDQRAGLIAAQSELLDKTMPGCQTAKPDLSPFVIVVQLDAQGKIHQTWRQGPSPLSICVQKALQDKQLPAPPHAPFLTSFELSFTP